MERASLLVVGLQARKTYCVAHAASYAWKVALLNVIILRARLVGWRTLAFLPGF